MQNTLAGDLGFEVCFRYASFGRAGRGRGGKNSDGLQRCRLPAGGVCYNGCMSEHEEAAARNYGTERQNHPGIGLGRFETEGESVATPEGFRRVSRADQEAALKRARSLARQYWRTFDMLAKESGA